MKAILRAHIWKHVEHIQQMYFTLFIDFIDAKQLHSLTRAHTHTHGSHANGHCVPD